MTFVYGNLIYDYFEDTVRLLCGVCHVLVFARYFVELSVVYNGKLGTAPKYTPVAKIFFN